jgi:anthranilate 1,2-dioxygenase small subunit
MSRAGPSLADLTLWLEVSQFLNTYADHLDQERFADWVALFDPENCRYEVLSRENRDLGLSLPIMGCFSHGMVQDRVAMLAKGVLTYRRDKLLRQVSNVQVLPGGKPETIAAHAHLVVYQSNEEGVSSLYMVARYELELVERANALKIRRMAVVLESFGIDTMLAVPL